MFTDTAVAIFHSRGPASSVGGRRSSIGLMGREELEHPAGGERKKKGHFHRLIALAAFLFVLAHPVILVAEGPALVSFLLPGLIPWHLGSGVLALFLLAALPATSFWRKALGIPYDGWRKHDVIPGVTIGDNAFIAAGAIVKVVGNLFAPKDDGVADSAGKSRQGSGRCKSSTW